MAKSRIITLSKNLYSRYHNRDGEVKCYAIKCDESFQIGSIVFSRSTTHRGHETHRLYCLPCADELNII